MGLPNTKLRGKQLKDKLAEVIDTPAKPVVTPTPTPETPPVEVPPVVVDPVVDPTVVPAVEIEMDVDELALKKKDELKPEELEYLKDNQDFLSPEQKIAFGFIPDPNPPVEPTEPQKKQDETDWQSRYAGSTREAQVLVEAKKKLTTAIDEADNIPAPTDEEMKVLHGDDWDMLEDAQKNIAKEREHDRRKLTHIQTVRAEFKKADEFVAKATAFTQDPEVLKKCPKLEGHEQEFLQYCAMPSHVGVDLEVLYRAFTTELPAPAAPKRKTLLEPGGGGAAPTPKNSPEYTPEQLAYLRVHKPKEYAKVIRERKINYNE